MVLEDSGGEDVLLPFNIASSISEESVKHQLPTAREYFFYFLPEYSAVNISKTVILI